MKGMKVAANELSWRKYILGFTFHTSFCPNFQYYANVPEMLPAKYASVKKALCKDGFSLDAHPSSQPPYCRQRHQVSAYTPIILDLTALLFKKMPSLILLYVFPSGFNIKIDP